MGPSSWLMMEQCKVRWHPSVALRETDFGQALLARLSICCLSWLRCSSNGCVVSSRMDKCPVQVPTWAPCPEHMQPQLAEVQAKHLHTGAQLVLVLVWLSLATPPSGRLGRGWPHQAAPAIIPQGKLQSFDRQRHRDWDPAAGCCSWERLLAAGQLRLVGGRLHQELQRGTCPLHLHLVQPCRHSMQGVTCYTCHIGKQAVSVMLSNACFANFKARPTGLSAVPHLMQRCRAVGQVELTTRLWLRT